MAEKAHQQRRPDEEADDRRQGDQPVSRAQGEEPPPRAELPTPKNKHQTDDERQQTRQRQAGVDQLAR